MLNVGDRAPAFDLPDQTGNKISLASLKGKQVVLYFYPKDDTPGCTVEACSFRDEYAALKKKDAVVLGVSPQGSESHKKFADKYSLPFPLLADVDHGLAEKFGAWGEKENYGRKYMGILRSTFIIGADGKISHVWPKVKTKGHGTDVLAALNGEAPAEKPAPAAKKKKAAPKKAKK
ncbi:MAG: thioredoxin-dependent thiol peroxidase [Myxococcaceae bacterium]